VVSLNGGEAMKKYQYTVVFLSDVDKAKKDAIILKIQSQLGPYVANDTITASSNAIEVKEVDVGETYPIYEGA
jgi:hypothetical protein